MRAIAASTSARPVARRRCRWGNARRRPCVAARIPRRVLRARHVARVRDPRAARSSRSQRSHDRWDTTGRPRRGRCTARVAVRSRKVAGGGNDPWLRARRAGCRPRRVAPACARAAAMFAGRAGRALERSVRCRSCDRRVPRRPACRCARAGFPAARRARGAWSPSHAPAAARTARRKPRCRR